MNVNLIVLAICCYGITQTKAWGNSRCGYPPIGKHSVFNVSDDGLEVNYLCSPFNDPEQGNTTVVCDSNNVWVGQPLDCKDAVNCVDERLPCLNGGKCIEHEPSFSCQCPKSYLGALCDEANGNWGKWSSWSNCSSSCGDGVRIRTRECDDPKPTNKGMMCKKHSMEVKDCYGVRCPDTMYRWCRSEHDRCGQLEDRAFCSVWKSSFRCQCLEGVTRIEDQFGNFVRCEDFDECATYPTKMCDAETTNCVNTFGSYECVCKDGFDKYRGMCQDVNECVTGSHNCDVNARCINLVGTYTCECLDGYRSISSNDSAYDGECKEARTLLFGFKAKDARVRIVTMATGEHVTPIVAMPSGIPLQDANGNAETCKSFYATENGVLLITNLTSWSDNQWKESYRHPVDFKTGVPPYSTSPHICAWVAPMWTDTTFRHRAKMWYQLYDMDALVRVDKRKRKGKYRLSQRIQKLLPANFRPKHVAIVTWDNVAPPWPSRGEEMTFQTILSTDGIRTFVTNIYEDQAMTWLPVYDVPRDVTEYQAVAGHYISGKSPNVWQHPASRKWSEKKGELNVYRLDQVRFKSTGILGIDTHALTPSVDFESSPGHKCQEWSRGQPPVPRDVWALIGTCPPNMGEVLVFLNTTWKLTSMDDGRKCFQWNYNLSSGGGFECCYQTDRDGSPLIAGINAFRRGAGFYFVNKTSDAVMRKTCCENATSNYFCSLYARLRPPATFVYYKPPVYVSGSPGIELTTINGSPSSITGNGEVRLLRTEKQYFPNPLFDMIARIKTTNGEARISAIGFQAENVTVELYSEEGDGKIVCLIDKKPCDSVMSPNASSVVGDGWVAVSTRSGNFINASSSPDGGLSFEAYLNSSRLNNPNYVTYGLLSDTGDCVSAAYSNQNRDSVPCDLQSLAAVDKQSVEALSFFTRFPQGQTTASYFAKPMSVTKVYQEINDRQMAPRNADVPEHLGRATAIAYQLQSGEYDVRINISAIDDDAIFDVTGALGNITMDGDDMVLRVDSSSLESLQILLQEPNETSLLFPDVTICACSGHGDCVINRDVTVGPHVTKAPCVCEVGYVGESCESKVDPCNGNPCFAGVRCAASPSGRLQAQCDPCPAPFQAGTGESCFHDNQCLTPATNLCVNALCVNRPYDYLCVCRPGFSKLSTSPYECEDNDECTEHHDCDSDTETCVNLHGSYRCNSNDATATEKAEVKEVNECLANNGGCERRCKNTNGSFYCVCEIGYKLRPDGFSCEEIDECDVYGNEHCTGRCEDKIKGKPFQCKCDRRYKMADDYTTCIPLFTTTVPETFVTTSTTQQPLTTAEGLKKTTSVLTTVADTTTSKYVASTVKTTRDSTTTMEFTTTASFLSLLSKEDRDLWNEMQNIPGFADLSPAEQLRALELLKALARLLGDPDLSSLLLLLADLPRHASLSRRCTALNLAMKRRGMEIASLESKLKKAENLARRFTNPNILSLKPDFSRVSPHFGSDDRHRRLSFGEILGYVELLRRCVELWRSRAEPTKAAAPQIERRHTPQRQSTAATTGPPKRTVHLPWVLAWIAIVTTLVVVIAFAAIIAGTRVCFSWKKGSEREKREKARKRKLERMKQWPRVVQTSYQPPGDKTSSIQW